MRVTIIDYFKKNRFNIFIFLIFLVLPFFFFRDAFKLSSVILGSGDAIDYISGKSLQIYNLKNFNLIFWNRYSYCGHPVLDFTFLYPISLLLDLIFPIVLSHNLSFLIHFSLAGIFLYLFLNEFNLNKFASFTSGLIFMFSGLLVSNKSIATYKTIIWFPLILLFLERFRKTKRIEFMLAASIFYSFAILGHMQVFFYGSIVLLLYIIYYSLIYKGVKNYFFLLSLLIFVIAFSVGFIFIYTINSSVASSVRGLVSKEYDYFSIGSLSPRLLPILFFPFLFGAKNPDVSGIPHFLRWFGSEDVIGMSIYFGILTIPFFIFGILRKDKHKYFWIFIMILSFLLVLGKYTPLNKLMYYIPIYNRFRYPTRNWFEFGLAFSILSGFGFDSFMKLEKRKVRKIILVSIGILSTVLIGFLLFYILFKNGFQEKIIEYFKPVLLQIYYDGREISEVFKESIKLTNYSIYMPLIIIIVSIFLLILAIFKRNKFIYSLIILFIFLDLFSWGHFEEKNTPNIFLPKDKSVESTKLEFLDDEDSLFRIQSLIEVPSQNIYLRSKNIYYRREYMGGYGYSLLEFNCITEIDENGNANWGKLLRNNNVISILNTRYIILPQMENNKEFMGSIVKYYWSSKGEPVLQGLKSNAEFKHSSLDSEENIIKISGEGNVTKFYKVPINIESDKDYMITFNIKANGTLDDNIFFDFYGDRYDFLEQDLNIAFGEIGEEYARFEMIINSNDVPENTDIYFRVYTTSGGEIWIKDLTINELKKYENYKVVYQDEEIFVLENINCAPRFFAPENIIPVRDYEEAKEILWEYDVKLDSERFDPQKDVLVEGWDIGKCNFNTRDVVIDINDYGNNEVSLDVESKENIFLVFSNTYYPGWSATVDGDETNIYRTDGTIQGIYVPGGKHRIVFNYLPKLFWLYMTISVSSFILTIGTIIVLFFRTRKKSFNND